MRRPPEIFTLEPANEDTTELSLIGRRDNKILGISAFVTGKLSTIVIVFILTRMSFFHKAFYLLFFHRQKIYLNQTYPHFDFQRFKKG